MYVLPQPISDKPISDVMQCCADKYTEERIRRPVIDSGKIDKMAVTFLDGRRLLAEE